MKPISLNNPPTNKFIKYFELLLDRGVAVNEPDEVRPVPPRPREAPLATVMTRVPPPLRVWQPYGRTALHVAARTGYIECVALLLQNGADVSIADEVRRSLPGGEPAPAAAGEADSFGPRTQPLDTAPRALRTHAPGCPQAGQKPIDVAVAVDTLRALLRNPAGLFCAALQHPAQSCRCRSSGFRGGASLARGATD